MRTTTRSAITLAFVGLLAACSATPTRESTGQYIDDSTITTRVKSAFVSDKIVSALRISVDTYKGTVQLSGFANSPSEITRAGELARTVPGVKAVANNILLKSQ